MNYNLNDISAQEKKVSSLGALRKLLQLITEERKNLWLALLAILVSSGLNLLGPFIIGSTIDTYVVHKNYHGVLVNSALLLAMYIVVLGAGYLQTRTMGGIGQRMLFKLRNSIFNKLQELPVAFFNQNKAGDLISRVNNDTDKLNQFFSQSLMQFIGSIATMTGAGIFLLSINIKLGSASLAPAVIILLFTSLVSPWVKRKNAKNLKSVGGMSAEIQESLNNFRVIIAFNRRDYFRNRFEEANRNNYSTAVRAGLANNIFSPVYSLGANLGQLIVLGFGIYLIATGHFTLGLLISFLSYISNFYGPLQQLAALWANFQVALAGWDRISKILSLESDLVTLKIQAADRPEGIKSRTGQQPVSSDALLEFRNVSFSYPDGKEVLHNNSFRLEKGRTYALVGPTGGGKTTTASLIARLYDPVSGTVFLNGKDIRLYSPAERTQKIGFILQEPFLF